MDITGKALPPCADIGTKQGWDISQGLSTASLLIHSDTTDGSTTFADATTTHSPVEGAVTVAHDTAQSRFGKSSILFDGDSGYITIPDHEDWIFGSGVFTIDFRVRFAALPSSSLMYFLSQYASSTVYQTFYIQESGGVYSLYFVSLNTGVTTVSVSSVWTTPAINTWYHLAVTRGWGGNANDYAICVDGKQIGTTTTQTDDCADIAGALEIGISGVNDSYFNGWLDEYRISKGTAQWTKNFMPLYGSYR